MKKMFSTYVSTFLFVSVSVAQEAGPVSVIDITKLINQIPRAEIQVAVVATPTGPQSHVTVITFTFVNFGTTTVDDAWIELLDPNNGKTLGRLHAPVMTVEDVTSAVAIFPGAHGDVRCGGIIECTDPASFLSFRRGINRRLTEEEANINVEIEPRSRFKQLRDPQPPARAKVPTTLVPSVLDLGSTTPSVPAAGVFLLLPTNCIHSMLISPVVRDAL